MIKNELYEKALTEVLETALKFIVSEDLAQKLSLSLKTAIYDKKSGDSQENYAEWVKTELIPHLDTRDLNIMSKLDTFSIIVTTSCLAYCKGFDTATKVAASLVGYDPSNP